MTSGARQYHSGCFTPPNRVLRTAIGPAILVGQRAVRSAGAQH